MNLIELLHFDTNFIHPPAGESSTQVSPFLPGGVSDGNWHTVHIHYYNKVGLHLNLFVCTDLFDFGSFDLTFCITNVGLTSYLLKCFGCDSLHFTYLYI